MHAWTQSVRESTAALVGLHGLTGTAGEQILQQVGAAFATQRAPDADKAGLWGGLVSGALGGLAADLAAGGLTLGAGALLGGIAGAYGARKLTQHYRQERGLSGGSVRWSDEFLDARLVAATIRYLAVAHFGRGRGEFQLGEPAPRWQAAVDAGLAADASRRAAAWIAARAGSGDESQMQDAGARHAGRDPGAAVPRARRSATVGAALAAATMLRDHDRDAGHQLRRKVMSHARDDLQARAADVPCRCRGRRRRGTSGSSAPWITSVGAVIRASSARRSPDARMAASWRAVPAG